MRTSVAVVLIFFTFMVFCDTAFSMDRYGYYSGPGDEQDYRFIVVNRPVNVQGLTGLIITNSAFTQPAGHIAIGISALGENSNVPNFSIVQGAATLTVGLTDRVEVGVKGKMIATNIGSSATREIGKGDSDFLIKWRFSSQGEIMPALAFGLAWTFPTADTSKGFSEVEYEGIKLMLIASSEKRILDDSFIGVYFEGQVVLNDQLHRTGASPFADKYGVLNAGLLFPISDNNRLQAVFEYNRVFKKDIVTLYEQNYSAVTPGLRYVTEHFNLSVGVQFLNKEQTGYKNDTRGVGTLSLSF